MTGSSLKSDFQATTVQPELRPRERLHPFSLRLTEAERARLEQAAGALSMAAYARLKLFSEDEAVPPRRNLTKKQRVPSAELTMLAQMLANLGKSRLASNLNQIAYALNRQELRITPELERDLHESCAAIQDMRQALISALGVRPK